LSKTPGAKSTPGLTAEEQAAFIATWIEPFQPKSFDDAMNKLIAIRAVRALSSPNNERVAALIEKLLRARWKIQVIPAEHRVAVFAKPGSEREAS